jgi:hypothetical protein
MSAQPNARSLEHLLDAQGGAGGTAEDHEQGA